MRKQFAIASFALFSAVLLSPQAAQPVKGVGCVRAGVEHGCFVLRDKASGEILTLHFVKGQPAIGQTIEFKGQTASADFCQQGRPVKVESFTVIKSPCPFVTVYKPDGTLQCNQGNEISLDQMETELTSGGIKIFSKSKQNDGLTHPQLCGTPTGRVNAYEISRDDLQKAMAKGFKVLREVTK